MLIDEAKLINDYLNINTYSSIGKLADAMGLGSIHFAFDSIGYAVTKAYATVGAMLGGDPNRITYHFEQEWRS